MPNKPMKPCKHRGCPLLTNEDYCEFHKRLHAAERKSASERGYDSSWRKARTQYLKENPLCVKCEEEGRITSATVVDHIKPHRGNYNLFWDQNNWQSLCKKCHDRKTKTTDRYKEYKY